MSANSKNVNAYLQNLLSEEELEVLKKQLEPNFSISERRLPRNYSVDERALARRWQILDNKSAQHELLDEKTLLTAEVFDANIEHFVGTVKVPVGVAGPLRVNGLFAQGDYFVPLATTEAALLASYHRGCQLLTSVGGCTTLILSEGVSRAPGFIFENLIDAGEFIRWAVSEQAIFKEIAESTTRFGKLTDLHFTVEGNHVYIRFEFTTADAAGQNMVTIATEAVLNYIKEQSPILIKQCFLEANLSGDKKASSQSFMSVRGKKVTAELRVPAEQVQKVLGTTPQAMEEYCRMSSMGGVLSGTIGVQGHYANGLAALFMATGQDVACVSEAAVGVTRLEETSEGDLYASVTLPNLIVGTVGGGTALPSQKACLDILGLAGSGNARAFAEVAAGLALAGELSIVGALCAGHFGKAHKRLARGKNNATGL